MTEPEPEEAKRSGDPGHGRFGETDGVTFSGSREGPGWSRDPESDVG